MRKDGQKVMTTFAKELEDNVNMIQIPAPGEFWVVKFTICTVYMGH